MSRETTSGSPAGAHTHSHVGAYPHSHHHAHHQSVAQPHDHDAEHACQSGLGGIIAQLFGLHRHSHASALLDTTLTTNERGIRAVKLSLAVLMLTALFQVVVVLFTGSVALLADTIHNFSDALTALPLWLAFSLARRAGSRRYTYGYGRAEDLAGALIVIMIFASASET